MVRTRAAESQKSAVAVAGRKRRASSIASQNDDVESANDSQQNNTQSKTRKRRSRRTDAQQLDQELGDAIPNREPAESFDEEHITVSTEDADYHAKNVRFSDEVDLSTTVRSSPPPRARMGRNTMSPIVLPEPTKSRKTRHSMPARLPETPDRLVDQIQFQPLTQTLTKRHRRSLKRNHLSEEMNSIEAHEKDDAKKDQQLKRVQEEIAEKNKLLEDLNWEVESLRQRGIDIGGEDDGNAQKIIALEAELAIMNEELTARHNDTHFDDDTDMDDDIEFVEPRDINITVADMTPNTSFERTVARPVPASLSPVPDQSRETEVHKFEKAILTLNQQVASAKASLQSISIELQSMGFAGEDEAPLVICAAIRQAFEQAHLEAGELLSDQEVNNYENAELLKLLIDNIRGLQQRVDEDFETIRRYQETEAALKGQHKGLLNKLAQSETRKDSLEKQWKVLDRQVESKSKWIIELEDAQSALESTVAERNDTIATNEGDIEDLQSDLSQQAKALQRLNDDVRTYLTKIDELNALVEDTIKEHAAEVSEIKESATNAIGELEIQLSEEQSNCQIAEQEIDEKTTEITQLQIASEAAETKLEDLKQQLAESKTVAASESKLRQVAELDLQQKNGFIDELESKIGSLEADLEDFRSDAMKLTELLEAERRQRQAAETDLDIHEQKVQELENRIHEEEVRGNELRMKLFQEQQDRAKEISELKDAAAERERQHQDDVEALTSRREEAERSVAARELDIEDLEKKIKKLDLAMVELLQAKDDLQEEIEVKTDQLEVNLTAALEEYKALAAGKDMEIQSLHQSIESLTEILGQRSSQIENLEVEIRAISQARQTENEEKDAQIAGLTDELGLAHDKISNLEAESSTLERRVEQEAMDFLQFQNDSSDQMDHLKIELRAKNDEIAKLKQDASNNAYKHNTEISSKSVEIASVQSANMVAKSNIEKLQQQVDLLQQMMRKRVNAERAAIPSMLNIFKQALANAEPIGDELVSEGVLDLEDVDDMESVETTGSAPAPLTNGTTVKKVTKKSRVLRSTKAVRDSGIGTGSDEIEPEDVLYA